MKQAMPSTVAEATEAHAILERVEVVAHLDRVLGPILGRVPELVGTTFTTTHRREGDAEWFFVAGEGKGEVELNASCEGRRVEIWDAVTGGRAGCPQHAVCANGKTRVSLDLPLGGSCFVVFAPAGIVNRQEHARYLTCLQPTSGKKL